MPEVPNLLNVFDLQHVPKFLHRSLHSSLNF